jgi:hypothetical protein
MRMRRLAPGLLLSVACTYLWPARSDACSCISDAIYRSEPEAGASDVALNQAILIDGAYVADSIAFEDAEGRAVEYDATLGPTPTCPGTSAVLVPRAPLRPDNRYAIRVQPMFPESEMPPAMATLSFTTGSSVLAESELEPPTAIASMISETPMSGLACGSGQFTTCVAVDGFDDVELLARRGDEIIMRWMMQGREGSFIFESAPDCMEFRRVGPTGKRSAVVAICDQQLSPRPFRPSDLQDDFVQCREGKVGSDAIATPAAPSDDAPTGMAAAAGSSAGTAADRGTAANGGTAASGGNAATGAIFTSGISPEPTAAAPSAPQPTAAACSASRDVPSHHRAYHHCPFRNPRRCRRALPGTAGRARAAPPALGGNARPLVPSLR